MMSRKILLTILLIVISLLIPRQLYAQSGKDAALEMTGYISGSLIFSTYTLIGTIHDAYVMKGLQKDDALTLLEEQSNLMSGAAKSYQKVLDSDFLDHQEDVVSIQDFLNCTLLLQKEAEELRKLLSTDYTGPSIYYHEARENAWKKIKTILQIKE